MPKNITVYLQDEIANEMDKFPEVSWSEVCRDAILGYIIKRSKGFETSAIKVTLENTSGEQSFGRTRLRARFKLTNASDAEVLLDRARYNLVVTAGNTSYQLPPRHYLDPIKIAKGNIAMFDIHVGITKNKLSEIAEKIGTDGDVFGEFHITCYLHGPLGLFDVSNIFQTRFPNSDWRKQFPNASKKSEKK